MFPISDASHKVSITPFITIGLIIANIVVFILQLTTSDPEAFIYTYALVPSQVDFANMQTLYPFISSMFLHGGFLHILGNMVFLWVFGDNVEDVFGHIRYLAIYLLSGVVGGFAQYVLSPHSDIPMLGASGAVAGVLGAYFVYFPNNSIKTFVFLPPFITMTTISAGFMLGYWVVLQLVSSFGLFSTGASEQGGVAFLAHVGGFAVGYIFAKLVPRRAFQEA